MEKKVVTKAITTTVYIANDGKEFKGKYECENYEDEQKQNKLEKEADEKLRIYTHADFPSMIDIRNKHEYRLFLIQNKQDLDLFIKAYKYWFTYLERYGQLNKDTFVYPDILCILDFPCGPDHPRLYRMSKLINQLDVFVGEIEEQRAIKQKEDETNV